ncbi:HutD/Ves family protein [Kineococcus arenarius]|uniref:HutD/Ves family protein n=1 Tax=unclassified Kineococcus TaxID=2621656 RepID=UPI003D7ECB77
MSAPDLIHAGAPAAPWVRVRDVTPVPWRNGGGLTRPLWRGAQWTLSLADIGGPGPFSAFPGWDRTFLLAAGDGLGLRVGDDERPLRVGETTSFPGEAPTAVDTGTGRALNLMALRDRVRGSLLVRTVHGPWQRQPLPTSLRALVVLAGRLEVAGSTCGSLGDTLLVDHLARSDRVTGRHALLAEVHLEPRTRSPHHPLERTGSA